MAIQYIEIDTAQLDRDIRELKAQISRTRKSLENMQAEIDELSTMWTGRANLAYRNQVAKDYRMMQSMLSVLEKLAVSMENAKKEYIRCENSVKSAVESIRI